VQKRVGIALIFVAILALAVFYSFRSQQHEPSYQGKSLRAWLDEALRYGRNWEASDAGDAVRKIGTNAIPDLITMLAKKDSFVVSSLVIFWNRNLDRIPIWVRQPSWFRNQAAVQNYEGEIGFEILGSKAEQAVPALMKLYEQNISPQSREDTRRALFAIGPTAQRLALPLFLQSAASSNAAVRETGVWAISEMSENQSQVVPVLVNALTDSNLMTRLIAAKGLARFGTNAQEAVPILTQLLNDNNRRIRDSAGDALNKIAPKAASKGGVK
jgi:HEAT repeat protein